MPFPEGESYADVALRVGEWLREVQRDRAGQSLVIIAHRAPRLALEHLINGLSLREAVLTDWPWQPEWRYVVGDSTDR